MWWSYLIELFFSFGLLINAVLFVPTAIEIYRTRTTKEKKEITHSSLLKYSGLSIFQIFTMLHGYFAGDLTLALGFLLSSLSCVTVTVMMLIYR